ncbi:MAG: nuclear transport factor 2 family protein [Burkholderiales bacterium]|nr:nuclear transport factor 2 family protein [Burkholderiales bacterium]
MYHAIVAHKVRAVFASISRGDAWPMIDSLAPRFVYRFEGDSPIGGVRNSRESMQLWWERMYRLFPGLSFVVRDVLVAGAPWNTRICTQLDFLMPLPDGRTYRNVVMQSMRMRWGRITEIHTLEDTQRCERLLRWQADMGKAEALAPPISDAEWPQRGPFMGAQPQPA